MDRNGRDCPYLGLLPFHEKDAAYFFGRDREIRLIKANLFASSLTLLYGPSGVGKSSVLRAGAVAELRRRADVAVVVFDRWQGDPAADLKRAAREAIEPLLDAPPKPRSDSLVDYLLACAEKTERRLILVLDQFEEYFLYHHASDAFAHALPLLVNGTERISVLLSLREDALAKLDRFEGSIPTLFDNYLRISHLSRQSARTAIVGPVKKYNEEHGTAVTIETALIDAVLDQVRTDAVAQILEQAKGLSIEESRSDDIEAPYLQLVMERVWRRDVRQNRHTLRHSTLEKLGGTTRIVKRHLDVQMRVLGRETSELAARVFHYLVTPSGGKIAHTVRDLARYAEVDPGELAAVMEALSHRDVRILRGVPPRPGHSETRYEIFHDVLASAILDWRERFGRKRAKVALAEQLADSLRKAEEERREYQSRITRQRRLLLAFGVLASALLLATGAATWLYQLQEKSTRALGESLKQNSKLLTELRGASTALIEARNDCDARFGDLRKQCSQSSDAAVQQTILAQQPPILPDASQVQEISKATPVTTDPTPADPEAGRRRASLERNPPWEGLELWANGATLRVSFLDGEPALQEKVFSIAREWTEHANLNFEPVYTPDSSAPIRVSFAQNGSWAMLGTTALDAPASRPTVNFGYLTLKTDPELMKQTVLHEFGHVLGLIHEFNNRRGWDLDLLQQMYSGPPYHWNREKIVQTFAAADIPDYRPFDPTSIMMYPLPDPVARSAGITQVPGKELSASDKELVRRLYPGR